MNREEGRKGLGCDLLHFVVYGVTEIGFIFLRMDCEGGERQEGTVLCCVLVEISGMCG